MRILLLLFALVFFQSVQGQDYYFKSFYESQRVVSRSVATAILGGGVVHVTQLSNQQLLIRRLDKCGNVKWEREIKDANKPIDLIDIKTDSAGNIICSGNFGEFNRGGRPFIMSVSLEGVVNYFKSINTYVNAESIAYSFLETNDGFYLYFNYGTGGTNSGQISVIKFNNLGNIVWAKSFPEMRNWGRAIATKDGGLLFRAGNSITKMDFDGTVAWSKSYTNLGYIDYPVEVKGGYVLFRYPSGTTQTTSNLIKIDTKGKVLWVSNDFFNFTPNRGVLRKNGNVLFTGNAQGVGLVEADTSSGTIIHFKQIDPNNVTQLRGETLQENEDGSILISGKDFSGIVGNTSIYLRIDSSLNLPTCPSNDLLLSSTSTPNITSTPKSVSTFSWDSQGLTLKNETVIVSTLINDTNTTICNVKIDRGELELGPDTIMCPTEQLILGSSTSSFDEYLWSTGEKTKQISIREAGSYSVTVIAACDTLKDTINVSYYPVVDLFIGKDTAICFGDSIILKSNFNLSNYIWSTGETSRQITVKEEGTYWLATITDCGEITDSITISFAIKSTQLELGDDAILCPGEEITLGDSLTDFDYFLWGNGQTTQFITVNKPGLYIAEARTSCDTLVDGIRVALAKELFVDFDRNKVTAKTFELIDFKSIGDQGSTAVWDFGDGKKQIGDSVSYAYTIAGTYTISLTIIAENGCEFSSSQSITIQPSDYIIPNVFSPNKDGINELFEVKGNDIECFEMSIYDRWGKEVFSKRKIAWDGRSKEGKPMKSGNYFYKIILYWTYGGSSDFEGNISLLR